VNTYQTLSGTEANVDEQHEPRTVLSTNDDGEQVMMTEIGDGTYVAWGNCARCRERIKRCNCTNGPVEPGHIEGWRTSRFTGSFKGRDVEPALPVTLHQRDRRIAAVLRFLLARGYTILAPGSALDASGMAELVWTCPECGLERISEDEPYCPSCDAENPSVVSVDLSTLEPALADCFASGEHLSSVDDDGYCNRCGYQDNPLMADGDGIPEDPDPGTDPDNLTGMDLGEGTNPYDDEATALQAGDPEALAAYFAHEREHVGETRQDESTQTGTFGEKMDTEPEVDTSLDVDAGLTAALERLKTAKEQGGAENVGF